MDENGTKWITTLDGLALYNEDGISTFSSEKKFVGNYLKIYPNPTSTTITIETPITGIITILNTSGQQLLQQEITEPTTTINVSGWKSGVYFARVTTENRVSVEKFIKQ